MSDLRSAIVATITTGPKPITTWIDRVPADVRDELLSIRREWHAGLIQASGRGLASAIIANCKERNIPICGFCGVREWLAKQD